MTPPAVSREGPWTPAVIIPAHNEGLRISVTLRRLYGDGQLAATSVIVVSNGCTDDTASQARATLAGLDHAATVIDLPQPGKANAIRSAEQQLPPGPRLILDADAGCDGATAQMLLAAVDSHPTGVAPAGVAVPVRRIVTAGMANPLVRAYYRVWQEFPWVRAMPSGRAAYALSWELREPLGPFPDLLGDDQWATSLVPRSAVRVVDAVVDVHPVPTLTELLAVRTRIYRGNRQSSRSHVTSPRGSQREAILAAARDPRNWPGLVVFMVVDRIAHRRARRARPAVWTKR